MFCYVHFYLYLCIKIQFMETKELRIETSKKWVYFYDDDVLIHKIKNVFNDEFGYRFEGYRKYVHSNAYLKGNRVYVTKTPWWGCGVELTEKDKIREVSYPIPKK